MLEISPRKVAQVILLARELYDSGYPGSGRANSSAEQELRSFIESLNNDEKASLVALMWIGRESFDADDLEEAIETARTEATTPTEDYLIGTPHLSDHLESGLDALGFSGEEEEGDLLR